MYKTFICSVESTFQYFINWENVKALLRLKPRESINDYRVSELLILCSLPTSSTRRPPRDACQAVNLLSFASGILM